MHVASDMQSVSTLRIQIGQGTDTIIPKNNHENYNVYSIHFMNKCNHKPISGSRCLTEI